MCELAPPKRVISAAGPLVKIQSKPGSALSIQTIRLRMWMLAEVLAVSSTTLPDARPLAGHKTTLRAAYDAGVRAAEAASAFDTLFFDAAGQLVEGGRSSVFVRIGGRWLTPPLQAGALPGVQRAQLLADAAWAAAERRITRAELQSAEAIVVCNALRGVLPARLVERVRAA